MNRYMTVGLSMLAGTALALGTIAFLNVTSSNVAAQIVAPPPNTPAPIPPNATAPTADSVTIVSATPNTGTQLARGAPVSINLNIAYTLSSADQAHLVVSIGEMKATSPNCGAAAGGELSDAAGVDIVRGTNQIPLTVVWSGDTGQATKGRVYNTGYIAFFPSIWTASVPRTRVAFFGMAPGYCYPFGP